VTAASPELGARIARYESFAKADPDNALIWISLGDLYHRAGRFDEAAASFERALLAEPGNAAAKSRLAGVAISRHDFAGAERTLRELVDAGDAHPALFHDLGLALLHQKRFDEALAALEHADPEHAPAVWLRRAQAHHQGGDTARAVECARAWAARTPGVAAEGYVALLEYDHGDLASARQRAAAVLEQDPENADASVVIGTWAAEQQDMERAEALFGNVVAREPESPRGWWGLGLMHLYRREFEPALRNMEQARTCQPGNAGLVTTIAWAHFLSGDLARAEATFRDAIAADRTFGEAHGGLAVVLSAQGRAEEARREIRRARGLAPIGFGHAYAQSVLLAKEGKTDEATRLLAEVFERRPAPDAPTLLEAVQIFARREAARAAPPPSAEPNERGPT